MTWHPLEPSTPHRDGKPIDIGDEEQWANDEYVVHVRHLVSDNPDAPNAIHLSIRRQDREPCRDWRDFQRIKNQLCGPEWEAVEIYPRESELIDMANQYHLWCFPFSLGIGFHNKRLVANNHQAGILAPGAVQRDPEPVDLQFGGLSKIKEMQAAQGPLDPFSEED